LNISVEEGALISAITPTPVPTLHEEATSESPGDETDIPVKETPRENNHFAEWFLTSILAWGSGLLFFLNTEEYIKTRNRATISAAIAAGGLLAALWLILGLPGSQPRYGITGYMFIFMITLIGEVIGGVLAFVYARQFMSKENS
jgi:hypothetical protein